MAFKDSVLNFHSSIAEAVYTSTKEFQCGGY